METIDALKRGLVVLRCLEEYRGQSLAEIHRLTGIPKPSLLRILDTLESCQFAWRAIGDGFYRRSISLAQRQRTDEYSTRIAEIAAPHLIELRRKVLWPSDILVCRAGELELVESSRRQSNMGVLIYKIGYRGVDMFLSAPGRAYFAFCTPEERQAVLEKAQVHPPAIPRSREVLHHELQGILQETRRLGYAWRDPYFGGGNADMTEFDDGLDAIAVPIQDDQRVIACINLVWPRKYKLKAKIVAEHLNDLLATAKSISIASRAIEGEPVDRSLAKDA